MHPREIAERAPDRPAVVMATGGEVVSFAELDQRSSQLAHLARSVGLEHGSSIAVFMENHPRYMEVLWAGQRAGLYYTSINSHLTAEEAAYIINDCGARLVVTSAQLAPVAAQLTEERIPAVETRLMVDGTINGWESYEAALAAQPGGHIADELEGQVMMYSSGTTGHPKGIKRPLGMELMGHKFDGGVGLLSLLGFEEGSVYLSPAPMYHSAPLVWSMAVQRLGGTVVIMEKFDPRHALQVMQDHRVTHGQFVPTMFVRMLKLPEDERRSFELSSLRAAVHAAAPCPVEVKREMIEWWGPIIYEYYSATEGMGATWITSEDWLAHPGSVGRSILGKIHILDEVGNELPTGEPGTVWFSGGQEFEYHNDPVKTAEARDPSGKATVGDMGYVDEEGYLYLTDRKTFMIVSGGVNIYPQECENLLVTHPKVADVAVIGVPNEDMGEEVKAVVQPVDWAQAGPELESELIAFCRAHLAAYKCPKTIDFEAELPRLDTGKLYKRLLRDRYWEAHKTRII